MNTPILRLGVRLLVPLLAAGAAVLIWRGHDAPGGGFIGALVAGVAFALIELTSEPHEPSRLPPATALLGAGLAFAVVTGLVPLTLGGELLEGTKLHLSLPLGGEIEFASSLFFDVGVALVVVGIVRSLLDALGGEPS